MKDAITKAVAGKKVLCDARLFVSRGNEGDCVFRCGCELGHKGLHKERFKTYERYSYDSEEALKDNPVVVAWKEDQRFFCEHHGLSNDPVECLTCSTLDIMCSVHGRQATERYFQGCNECGKEPYVCPEHGPSENTIGCPHEDCLRGVHERWSVILV